MSNPKSKWYSTAKRDRKRPGIEVMLPPELTARITELAREHGISRSRYIELVLTAYIAETGS